MVILIKGGKTVKVATKKTLQAIAKEAYRVVSEILIGVLLIYISRYI